MKEKAEKEGDVMSEEERRKLTSSHEEKASNLNFMRKNSAIGRQVETRVSASAIACTGKRAKSPDRRGWL